MSTTTTQSTIPAGTFTVDTSHSHVGFVARHAMVTKVRGSFNEFSATATFDPAVVLTIALTFVVMLGSIFPWLALGATGTTVDQLYSTQDITAVWKEGAPVDLNGYQGSPEEETDLAALQATTEKIIAAIHQAWPQFTP